MQSLEYESPPKPVMKYWSAYRFFFASPKAWTNLLLGAVCVLIPIVGQIAFGGYVIEVMTDKLWDDGPDYPDFIFGRFGEYLSRGVWPFLVQLIASIAMILPIAILQMMVMLTVALSASAGPLVLVVMACVGSLLFLASLALMLQVMTPLLLRAALLRNFSGVFNVGWVVDFIRRTWGEMVLCGLFLFVTAIPLVLVGEAMCFIGVYPAIVLVTFAYWRLSFKLYRIYLARGGMAVTLAPMSLPAPQ